MQKLVVSALSLLYILIADLSFAIPEAPFEVDEHTIALWHFDNQMPEFTEPVDFIEERFKGIHSVIRCQDDGYVICGTVEYSENREGQIPPRDGYLMKLNPQFMIEWVNIHEDETDMGFTDLVETEDDNLMVVGGCEDLESINKFIYREYNQDGELLNQGDISNEDDNVGIWYKCLIIKSTNGDLIIGRDDLFGTKISKFSSDMQEIWLFERELNLGNLFKHKDGYMLLGNSRQSVAEVFNDDGDQIMRSENLGADSTSQELYDGTITDSGYLLVGYRNPPRIVAQTIGNSWIVCLTDDLEFNQEYYQEDMEKLSWAQQITALPSNKYLCTGSLNSPDGHGLAHEILTLHLMDESGTIHDTLSSRLGNDFSFDRWFTFITLLNNDLSYSIFSTIRSHAGGNDDSFIYPYIFRTTPHKIWNYDCSGNSIHLNGEDGVYSATDGLWEQGLRSTMDEEIIGFVRGGNELLQPEQFTIEAWIKLDQEDEFEGTVLCKRLDEDRYSWSLNADNVQNRIDFYVETEDGEYNVSAEVENLNNSEWHYVAVNYDGENISLFVDDAYVEWEFVGSPMVYGDGELIIGGRETRASADGQFYGLIDEIRISDAVREEHSVSGINPQTYPTSLKINEVYPNPFNSSVTISYTSPKSSEIMISIIDLYGREITVLQNGKQMAGSYNIIWDGCDLSSGLYFCRLEAEGNVKTAKLMLVK